MKRLIVIAAFAFAITLNAAPIAIQHVRLFDGSRVIPDATVVFDGDKIVAAGARARVPAGASVIDGRGKTLLPGLIDAHTHIFPGSLERALRFGVTTELDMFTMRELANRMRDEQKKGDVTTRADLYSANTLVTVAGGHGTEYFKIPVYAPGSDPQAFIDARIAEGSDYIKLIYDDGSAWHRTFATLTRPDLAALIAAAHKRGKMAVVHIATLAGARDAIEAGADGLAHIFGNVPPDATFARFAAAHHVFVVPTLTVLESAGGSPSGASLVKDEHLHPYLSEAEVQNLNMTFGKSFAVNQALENASAAVRELKAAGVPILAGTDAPNPGTAHGASIHRELELLVKAGLTPTEALAAATSVPARLFHLKDRGQIVPGARADLVLVSGDPTADITATRNIDTIWRNGVPLERKPEVRRENDVEKIAPDRLTAGMISNFDDGTPGAQFGSGWVISTDSMMGGVSTATMTVVDGGANGTPKSFRIHADTKAGAPYPWAGAMLFFGSQPMRPVDLSSVRGLAFMAKGDIDIRVMLFARSAGYIPRIIALHAGPDWTPLSAAWKAFGIDGKDVEAVLFAGPESGAVDFNIDELRLDPMPVH